jgi:drug/metabolite transporter (DMT)-like permease
VRVAVLLSLLSASSYGVSDFLGGIFAKRATAWQIAVVGQASAGACSLAALVLFPGSPAGSDLAWGAVAGIGGGLGAGFLYRGLSSSRMGVVAPISAIGTALLPVVVGLSTGERPSPLAFVAIATAFPAIVLISRVPSEAEIDPTARGGAIDGILAGLGFGFSFVCLDRVGDDGTLAGLAAAQVMSVLAVIALATALRGAWVPRDRFAARAIVMGPLSATAQGAFVFATQSGLLSIVSVISSLYPASTVVLAAVLLHERIWRGQAVGLVLATAAVVGVALA